MISSPFYKLTEILALIIVLSLLRGYVGLKNTTVRYGLGFAGFGVLYLLCGGFSFIFVGFIIGYELFFKTKKNSLYYISILVLWAVVLPYSARFWGFYMSNENAYLNLLLNYQNYFHLHVTSLTDDIRASAQLDCKPFILVGYFLLLPCIIFVLKTIKFALSKWALATLYGGSFMLIGLSFYFWTINPLQDKYEKICLLAEREDWEAVWLMGKNHFLDQDKGGEGFYPAAMSEYTKLAAIMTRRLGEDYPDLIPYSGFETLFYEDPTRKKTFYNSTFSIDFYYHIGLFVLARQEIYTRTEFSGVQNQLLRRMIQTNTVLEDTMRNFLYENLLAKTPFQKQFLTNLEKDTTYLANKRRLRLDVGFPLELNPTDLLVLTLSEKAPHNPFALEYACMITLLYLKNEQFLIDRLPRFQDLNYTHLPRFFEEALIVSSGYGIDPQITGENLRTMDFGGFSVREETLNRAEAFFNYLQRMNQGLGNFKTFENEFRNTYFFHKFMRISN
jgi:hypothetical protein